MRSGKMLAAVATVVATLLGANSEIQAGGAGDPSATCVVHSPSGQSLTGSAALTVHFIGGTTADSVEVTLALERQSSGNPQFFRRIITGTIQVLSPQGLACQVRLDASNLEKDSAGSHDRHPVVWRTLSATHAGLGGLCGCRLIGENADPDLPASSETLRPGEMSLPVGRCQVVRHRGAGALVRLKIERREE